MFGNEEDRILNIERQLEKLVLQVNRFVEAVTQVLIAAGDEEEAQVDDTGLPQDNSERSNQFWSELTIFAIDHGFYVRARNCPEHRKVAAFLGVQINDVIKSWNDYASMRDESVEVVTRIPTEWFEKMHKAFRASCEKNEK